MAHLEWRTWRTGAGARGLALALAAVGMVLAMAPAIAGQGSARWYTPGQVAEGREIYAANCALCHGTAGEGEPNWQERDAMGYYPAPPLNAGGHAAQHPLQAMLKTLDTGGGPMGGTMPSFIDVLDASQQRAVIAYVQSLWGDPLYAVWEAIDAGRAEAPAGEHHH